MPTPNALEAELEAITKTFVTAVVAAMRRASLTDILGVSEGQPAKRGRGRPPGSKNKPGTPSPTPEASAITITAPRPGLIVAYVKSHPGTSGEEARAALGIPKPQWGTYVARALKGGQLRREGQKRATKYWAV
jgi:hypothetical protein